MTCFPGTRVDTITAICNERFAEYIYTGIHTIFLVSQQISGGLQIIPEMVLEIICLCNKKDQISQLF